MQLDKKFTGHIICATNTYLTFFLKKDENLISGSFWGPIHKNWENLRDFPKKPRCHLLAIIAPTLHANKSVKKKTDKLTTAKPIGPPAKQVPQRGGNSLPH